MTKDMLTAYRTCSKCKKNPVYRPTMSWCRKCNTEAARRKRALKPDYSRERNLVSRYGLTLAGYEAKLKAQGGVCGSCKRVPKKDEIFHVDHDHACCPRDARKTCGKCIRDLLCISCNMIVGKLEKNTFAPQVAYLERWSA